ncbi:hypothetical protein UNDKW_4386 [Undibacterium sp. KW1]|nr:hypothetical protein UNDKW_4386 [Undibacterium sp. KW1]
MLEVIDQHGKVRDLAALAHPCYISAHGNELVVESSGGQLSRYTQGGEGEVFHKLERPSTGFAIDAEGNIYVGGSWDKDNISLIHKISKTGEASVYITGGRAGKLGVLGYIGNGYLIFAQDNDILTLWQSANMSFVRKTAYPGFVAVRRDFNFPG